MDSLSAKVPVEFMSFLFSATTGRKGEMEYLMLGETEKKQTVIIVF